LPAVARRRVEAPISRGIVPRVVDLISRGVDGRDPGEILPAVAHRDVALGLIAAARQAVGQILPAMIAVVRRVLDQGASVRWGGVPISRGVTLVRNVAIVSSVVAAVSEMAAVNRIPPVGLINLKVK
jgi:hypothetical protein